MNITSLTEGKTHHARLRAIKQSNPAVVLGQKHLTVEQVVRVARYQTPVGISDEQQVLQRVESSSN